MLKNVYEGLNDRPKVYLSKEYFCEMYPTCVTSKLCEFIGKVCLIKVVSDFSYRHWKCLFSRPQLGHFWQKWSYWGAKKWHFQCRHEKSETTFIRQTFPKNEVYDL